MATKRKRDRPPTSGDADSIVQAIYLRRLAVEDPDLGAHWSDEVADAVRYVGAHQRVPAYVVEKDRLDALRLVHHLRAELDRYELQHILGCRKLALPWQRIAQALGLHSYQAAQRRAEQLQAGANHLVRQPEVLRAERRRERAAASWIETNQDRVLAATRNLLEERRTARLRLNEDAEEWFDDLEVAAREEGHSLAPVLAYARQIASADESAMSSPHLRLLVKLADERHAAEASPA
jgi:hypothetical protein